MKQWYLEEKNFIEEFARREDISCKIVFEQLRSLWTTFCLHFDLVPDTGMYDLIMLDIYGEAEENKNLSEKLIDFDSFDDFMCGCLG